MIASGQSPLQKVTSQEEDQELRKLHSGSPMDFEADAKLDEKFGEEGDDLVDFFDFTNAIETPDSTIIPQGYGRLLQAICILPNKHVLIEGNMMDSTVEVYQVESNQGSLTEPIQIIRTDCRGVSAFLLTDELIYMGFMMSLADM